MPVCVCAHEFSDIFILVHKTASVYHTLMKFLLDHNFRVYKTYLCPIITDAHESIIHSHIASYIFLKYQSQTSDLVPKYKYAEDVKVTVTSGHLAESDVEVNYVIIGHDLTHIIAFVKSDESFIALIKSHTPLYVLRILESLEFDKPLILQPLSITSPVIFSLVDHLESLVVEDPRVLGDIDLAFSPKEKLIGDSLKELIVRVPYKDSSRLLKDRKLPPMQTLVDWLTEQTTLNFSNLLLTKFSSKILNVHQDHLTIVGVDFPLDNTIAELLKTFCITFNSN